MKPPITFEQFARLAGRGALGASGGLAAVYAGAVFLTFPGAQAGMDRINAAVAWIAIGGLVVALMVFHVLIGKRLLLLSQGKDKRHPL